jgi:hypothetical protein
LSDGAGSILAALAVLVPLVWLIWRLDTARVLSFSSSMSGLLAGALAALFAAAMYWRAAGRRESRRLRWDGTCWHLLSCTQEGEELLSLELRIDLGCALLVRARRPIGRSLHLPLERRDSPEAWHGLRVALANSPADRARSPAFPGPGVAT